jgi:hypothetical protein
MQNILKKSLKGQFNNVKKKKKRKKPTEDSMVMVMIEVIEVILLELLISIYEAIKL